MSTVSRLSLAMAGGIVALGLTAGPALASSSPSPAPASLDESYMTPAPSTTPPTPPTTTPPPTTPATPPPTTPAPSASATASVGSNAPLIVQAPTNVKALALTRKPAVKKVATVTQPSGSLAYTGSDAIVGGLAVGSVLVLVGGVLVVGTRRRGTAS